MNGDYCLADFSDCFRKTFGDEGGLVYTNDPDDSGGETKGGISKKAHPELDIKNLTQEQIEEIYFKEYWKRLNLHLINNQQIRAEIFDTAVNMGPYWAIQILQQSLYFLGLNCDIDGAIGKQTIALTNQMIQKDSEALFKVLNGFQFMRYVKIIESRPKDKKFARGWMKRIQSYVS
jgi:lysozyme family protein